MLKDNGMLKPADKKELAGLKGKSYFCPTCNKKFNFEKSSFASTVCEKCGSTLIEEGMEAAGKITG